MARTPKPWFSKARNGWYVTIGGTRHFLSDTKVEATTRFGKEDDLRPVGQWVRLGTESDQGVFYRIVHSGGERLRIGGAHDLFDLRCVALQSTGKLRFGSPIPHPNRSVMSSRDDPASIR